MGLLEQAKPLFESTQQLRACRLHLGRLSPGDVHDDASPGVLEREGRPLHALHGPAHLAQDDADEVLDVFEAPRDRDGRLQFQQQVFRHVESSFAHPSRRKSTRPSARHLSIIFRRKPSCPWWPSLGSPRGAEVVHNRAGGQAAGLIARLVAAHAVGHHQERDFISALGVVPVPMLGQKAVLIACTHPASGQGATQDEARR